MKQGEPRGTRFLVSEARWREPRYHNISLCLTSRFLPSFLKSTPNLHLYSLSLSPHSFTLPPFFPPLSLSPSLSCPLLSHTQSSPLSLSYSLSHSCFPHQPSLSIFPVSLSIRCCPILTFFPSSSIFLTYSISLSFFLSLSLSISLPPSLSLSLSVMVSSLSLSLSFTLSLQLITFLPSDDSGTDLALIWL